MLCQGHCCGLPEALIALVVLPAGTCAAVQGLEAGAHLLVQKFLAGICGQADRHCTPTEDFVNLDAFIRMYVKCNRSTHLGKYGE